MLSKHFQILGWICHAIEDNIKADSSFIDAKELLSSSVLSRDSFLAQANRTLNTQIQQNRVNYRYGIDRLAALYRDNLIANAFNTDWTLEYGDVADGYLLRSVPRWFANGSCNCVVSSECHRPLRIGPPDLALPGLVAGCSPIYGLRQSTLECLFSSDCISTILKYLHYDTQIDGSEPNNFTPPATVPLTMAPLDASKLVQFSPTTLIGSILDAAFIEQLDQTLSYENYFNACAPINCHYEYKERNGTLYVFTSLLALYGGLTISLRIIIWNTARMYQSIKRHLRMRTAAIAPVTLQ